MAGWSSRGLMVLVALIAAVAAAAMLSGCEAKSPTKDSSAAGERSVVCTTAMIADAARRVAGDRAAVTSLMGEGIDPHLYKAAPGDVRLLSAADLILYNGLHLEGRMGDVLVRLASRKPTVQVTDSIPEQRLREPPEFEGQHDPHVWFDVSLWMMVVERIEKALTEVDPEGEQLFQANAAAYIEELKALHAWINTEMATIPAERRVLVTAHDAFGYFGDAYGTEVMGVQGISTDSEASIRDINSLVDTLVARRVPAVFVESSVPQKTVEALIEGCRARGHGVVIGGELFSDAMGRSDTPEGTYLGMVRHNVSTIVKALRGAPSEPSS